MTIPQPHQVGPPSVRKPSGGLMALGILTIIYAVFFNLCGSIVGLSLPLWMPALFGFMEEMIPDALNLGAIFQGPFMAYVVIGSFVSLVLGLSFLSGGIGLLKLRPWGRALSLGASVATIVWNIINLFIGFFLVNPMVNDAIGQETPRLPQLMGQVVGSLFGLIFQLALPVALLVFLTRTQIKEQFEPLPDDMRAA